MSRCRLDACTIAVDGECIEGRGASCPNLISNDRIAGLDANPAGFDEEWAKNEGTVQPMDPQSLSYIESESLYPGEPLEISEAREITMRSRTTMVTLVGMIESGKTSLLARIHQEFQSGPLGDYEFAGSKTLLRFEEINWLATIESGSGKPAMEHTSRRYDNTCLHLTVQKHNEPGNHIDLLLNDISGDTYPDAISAATICEGLYCLHRADHLVVVVDGAAMVDRNLRYDHSSKALEFVMRALRTGQIGPWTILHLVISKLDVLKDQPEGSPSMKAVARLEADFKSKSGLDVAQVHCWRIAARPLDGSLPTTETISQIFHIWLSSTNRYSTNIASATSDLHSARDFSRFGANEEVEDGR